MIYGHISFLLTIKNALKSLKEASGMSWNIAMNTLSAICQWSYKYINISYTLWVITYDSKLMTHMSHMVWGKVYESLVMSHRLWLIDCILTWWYGHDQTSIAEVTSKTTFLQKTVFTGFSPRRQNFYFLKNLLDDPLVIISNIPYSTITIAPR